jgi:low temperature requirement protein LtrA
MLGDPVTTPDTTQRRLRATGTGHRVTPAELFFDLVFVYAITQVTSLMSQNISGRRIAEGVLVFCLLWWCWCCFAWLGNVVRADMGAARLALFAVMALMLVIAITVPETFDDLPGGEYAPLVFVVCYLTVRLLHLSIYWISDPHDRDLHRVLLRAAASLMPSAALLFAGALLGGAAQLPLWTAAFALDFVGIYLTGAEGWRIASPAHWAERHALIVIIALGESIVALGVGVAELPVSWPLIATVTLGLSVAASLWILYFDGLEQAAEHRLAALDGRARTAMARDGYTYLHLFLVAGIIVTAVGLKKVASYVSDSAHHDLGDALTGISAWALTSGIALYLLGSAAFALRTTGERRAGRLIAGGGFLLAGFAVPHVPALVALLLVAAILAALAGVESGLARVTSRGPTDGRGQGSHPR